MTIKILVIEDEEQIRTEVMDWLMFEDYEVFGASNGRQGVEIAVQELPDLIISDIAMPEMDGYEVLLEVRSDPRLGDIPFIFVTASAERESVRRGMAMGADDYITKPFTHSELMSAVNARLKKFHAQQAKIEDHLDVVYSALEHEREQRLLKSRMVAMFSHDFRNPLSVILSSANLMLDYDDKLTPDRRHKKLKRIVASTHLLMRMIDEMLLLAEMEDDQYAPSPEAIHLSHFVEDVVEDFIDIHNETHNIHYESSVTGETYIDPDLVRQIVANLVSNATKYSPPNSNILVKLIATDISIDLFVQDEGIGIPQQDLDNLFEPFHRAENAKQFKGTGLGLAIVKQAVDMCNAQVKVTSKVGKGSIFQVCFPNISPPMD